MTCDDELQLDREFGEISSRVWTPKIVETSDQIPDLFHYTDTTGLLGIIRSCSRWATEFQSLNDVSEMHYGRNRVRDLINTLDEKESEKKRFLRNAMDLLGGAFVGAPPYVVSFCDLGNLLSQWRAYGDGGAGFSIAFDCKELSKLFVQGTSVLPITYDP